MSFIIIIQQDYKSKIVFTIRNTNNTYTIIYIVHFKGNNFYYTYIDMGRYSYREFYTDESWLAHPLFMNQLYYFP